MRLGKSLLVLSLLPAAWYGYGLWLAGSIPHVEIREITPLMAKGDRALPFFELMSPMPDGEAVPKLEYKKGPPDRFLERISVILQGDSSKERIIYHGRRTRNDLLGVRAFPEEPAREAHYIEAAIKLSQGKSVPELEGLNGFLYGPFALREAARWLNGVETVSIMDQAGTPAFLFDAEKGTDGRSRSTALFIRRSSFYRVDYLGDRGFSRLDPSSLFRKTFLTEKRSDALEYLAKNLSDVHVENQSTGLHLKDIAWPVMLLAANMSVDPSSLDSYFHFAGINALLYRSSSSEEGTQDLEISDALRNNVLASDLYAHDVAPEAPKTAEIARLARLLTRNFDQ